MYVLLPKQTRYWTSNPTAARSYHRRVKSGVCLFYVPLRSPDTDPAVRKKETHPEDLPSVAAAARERRRAFDAGAAAGASALMQLRTSQSASPPCKPDCSHWSNGRTFQNKSPVAGLRSRKTRHKKTMFMEKWVMIGNISLF